MNKLSGFFGIVLFFASTLAQAAFVRGEIESGLAWTKRLDFRYPSVGGDTVALNDIDEKTLLHFRLEAWLDLPGPHKIRGLYTPYSYKVSNTPTENIFFIDTTFAAGQGTNYEYKFNSYRLTYIYELISAAGLVNLDIGFTAKIRDAKISVSQPGLKRNRETTDIGFVPLLYAELSLNVTDTFGAIIQFDGLAAPGGQGRAFDISAKLRLGLVGPLYGFAGYRLLDGGADNDSVFTFANIQYGVIGLGAAI